jgi:hypothetical protein
MREPELFVLLMGVINELLRWDGVSDIAYTAFHAPGTGVPAT